MNLALHKKMVETVALSLGEDLLQEVAFVGGCTTGLLLEDQFSMEQVRHTDDVDLIVHVVGRLGWHTLQTLLRSRGFRDEMRGCADMRNEVR